MWYGAYAEAQSLLDDLAALADEKDASLFWKATAIAFRGALFALTDPRPVSRSADKLFARIRGAIKDGFPDPDFGPVEVAAEAGISLRYVQRLLTERGTTCGELIYSHRLDHAAHLLHRRALFGTGRPLSQIAYACGFRDYAHFARRFHKRFGCSPGAYAGPDDGDAVRAGTGKSASSARDVQ
jgi:AraC-like DNA-binding protein